MLYYVVRRCAMLYYVMLRCAMLRYVLLCCAMLCYVALCSAIYVALFCAMLRYVLLCCSLLCYAMLFCAILCYVVLCCPCFYSLKRRFFVVEYHKRHFCLGPIIVYKANCVICLLAPSLMRREMTTTRIWSKYATSVTV